MHLASDPADAKASVPPGGRQRTPRCC